MFQTCFDFGGLFLKCHLMCDTMKYAINIMTLFWDYINEKNISQHFISIELFGSENVIR